MSIQNLLNDDLNKKKINLFVNNLNVKGEFIASGIKYPTSDGTIGQVISTDGAGILSFSNGTSGPGSSIDNSLTRFDGITGQIIQDSNLILSDINEITSTLVNGDIVLDPNGSGKLNVKSDLISKQLDLVGGGTGSTPRITFGAADGVISYETGTGLNFDFRDTESYQFKQSGVTKMRLKTNGSFDIIDGNLEVNSAIRISSDGSGSLKDLTLIGNLPSSAPKLIFSDPLTQVDYIAGSGFTWNNRLGDEYVWKSDTFERMKLETSGAFFLPGLNASTGVNLVMDNVTKEVLLDTSSKRYKENIQKLDESFSEKIYLAEPVIYNRKNDPDKKLEIGLIAEQLNDVGLSEYVILDDKGLPDAINYSRLVIPIIMELKKLKEKIENLIS